MAKAAIKAAILDVDGTLVDSNDLHAQSWAEALSAFGYDIPYEQIRPLIGMGGDRLMPEVSGISEDSVLGKRISAWRKKVFKDKYLPQVTPFPGVRELLNKMKATGLKLVVASSSGKELLNLLLKRGEIDDLIDDSTSSDDAESSKPAPDIIEAALDKAGLNPHDAIMLGDTPYDVEASRRAGVEIVALESGGWSKEQLKGASMVFHDPEALLQEFDRSPFNSGFSSGSGKDLSAQL